MMQKERERSSVGLLRRRPQWTGLRQSEARIITFFLSPLCFPLWVTLIFIHIQIQYVFLDHVLSFGGILASPKCQHSQVTSRQ